MRYHEEPCRRGEHRQPDFSPSAQKPSPAVFTGPAKVAVIAFQAAVSQTNSSSATFPTLQKKYEPKRQDLKTLASQIDTLTKQLEKQGPQLGEAERMSRARTLD